MEKEMQAKKKILFAAAEVLPFAATGGLGEVTGSLPEALAASGAYDVRVVMPLYEDVGSQWRSKMSFLGSTTVSLAWRELYCGVFALEKNGVTYYFIDNEYYFKRNNGLYGYYDDGERYAFFSKAVLDTFELTQFVPDILHAHDWQTALIPVYLTYRYQYPNMRTIFTIHNIEYQGNYDLSILGDVFALPPEAGAAVEYHGGINLMKGALECSHCISTVSSSYAKELHDPAYAHGLEAIIERNSGKMRGILNGIDVVSYDPSKDEAIFVPYSSKTRTGKKTNKLELQKLAGLPEDPDAAVLAVVSRLADHKGIELICRAAETLLQGHVQIVVLGKGDARYEDWLRVLAERYPNKLAAMLTYNKDLSRKVYAGADIFLMPSRSEPCGLSQMIACRYGTIPIVRATGGLRDSIRDVSGENGIGFLFEEYSVDAFLDTVNRALDIFSRKREWGTIITRAMKEDFSWNRSAKAYAAMYEDLQG